MNKALKAFNRIWSMFDFKDMQYEHRVVIDALAELEALKKVPTAEDICKALSEHYHSEVSYSNERHNHMFYFEESRLGILRYYNGGLDFIHSDYHKTNNLLPCLVALIGKFYESLEEEKWNELLQSMW